MTNYLTQFDAYGNIVAKIELPEVEQMPLRDTALVATLNAVLGIWSLEDAANIAQLPEQALIAEAEAWAVAGGNQ